MALSPAMVVRVRDGRLVKLHAGKEIALPEPVAKAIKERIAEAKPLARGGYWLQGSKSAAFLDQATYDALSQ